MKSLILNSGYNKNLRFTRGLNQFLYTKNDKFLDLSMCSGTMFLGHSSKVFQKAVNEQKTRGSSIGLPNESAEIFSKRLKKIFPQFSNFIISSTGAEANIRAIRIARAVTKKDKIVMVGGSWHGSVDSLLFDQKMNKKTYSNIPLSSGLSSSEKKNIVLVPYNNFKQTVQILKKHKKKIALLIIEPIQQYLPTIFSEKYVQELFHYCKKNKILICFDEMITGLRIREFSVQQRMKLKPDLSTFGKIIGGGFPISVVAVSAELTKKIKKLKSKIFFGGTFSANQFSCKVGYETLDFILKNKKKIYDKVDYLAKYFENQMNNFFEKNKFEMRLYNYFSITRIVFTKKVVKNRVERDSFERKNLEKIKKFKKFVNSKKILHPETGAYFISYCHDKRDIDKICSTFKKGIEKFFS